MDASGIEVTEFAYVDELLSFHFCTFQNGAPNGTLLIIDNEQDIVIQDAVFPHNINGSAHNVAKTVDKGEISFDNATGLFAGSAFENDPFNRIQWSGTGDIQELFIPEGWSGISSYINPQNPLLEIMFHPIMPQLVILYNMQGYFWPMVGGNTLINWHPQSGYVIKVTGDVVLDITGEELQNKTIGIKAGWNIIPVYSNVYAPTFFGGLPGFVVAKGVATPEVLWPQFNISTLQQLDVGKAYYVYSTMPGILHYWKSDDQALQNPDEQNYEIRPHPELPITPFTHLIAFTTNSLKAIPKDHAIVVFTTSGHRAGEVSFSCTERPVLLMLNGCDYSETQCNGFFEGEQIIFGLWNNKSGEVMDLEVTWEESLNDSGLFETHGLSAVVDLRFSGTGMTLPLRQNLIIYPNPANHKFTLTGPTGYNELTIFNAHGKEILTKSLILPAEVDLSEHPKGIYFISIKNDKQVFFEKLILN